MQCPNELTAALPLLLFYGCGITEDLVASGLLRRDRMRGWWTDRVLSVWWTPQRWLLLRSGLLPACVCGNGGRCVTANAM